MMIVLEIIESKKIQVLGGPLTGRRAVWP